MNLSVDERRELLEEIIEITSEPELEENEITVRMYSEQEGISISIAANRLEKAWSGGKLNRREVLHEGKRKKAYSINHGECTRAKGN